MDVSPDNSAWDVLLTGVNMADAESKIRTCETDPAPRTYFQISPTVIGRYLRLNIVSFHGIRAGLNYFNVDIDDSLAYPPKPKYVKVDVSQTDWALWVTQTIAASEDMQQRSDCEAQCNKRYPKCRGVLYHNEVCHVLRPFERHHTLVSYDSSATTAFFRAETCRKDNEHTLLAENTKFKHPSTTRKYKNALTDACDWDTGYHHGAPNVATYTTLDYQFTGPAFVVDLGQFVVVEAVKIRNGMNYVWKE